MEGTTISAGRPASAQRPQHAASEATSPTRPNESAHDDASRWGPPLGERIVQDGLTFDDLLLVPRGSAIMPERADTSSRLTAQISLGAPLVSAPMDTVTESALAIALALEGGLGVIHRNLDPETQAREVTKVKRSANGVIVDPITLGPTDTIARARDLMKQYNVSGFPVTEDGSRELRAKGRLLGILTRRDLKFVEDPSVRVEAVMTSGTLITAPPDCTLEEASRILNRNKVEKLLLVGPDGRLAGMVTQRDIERMDQFPRANTDQSGRLRCGAACGVDQYDRVQVLLDAGADVIVIDTSHGHSENVIRTVKTIKERFGAEVVAGNVVTAEGAAALAMAGADAVKAGIGPGSICTTRIVTGVGVPQISAIANAVDGIRSTGRDVPVIADGGIRQSGDIAKALAVGAEAVMLGSLFAGLDESPGELVISEGRRYKSYRGMGSEGAMAAGSADRYGQGGKGAVRFVPEGVEGLAPYRGTLADFVFHLVGGVRASMGYLGCANLDEFRRNARFCRVTAASVVESHPHNIRITKESSNYMSD